MDQRKENLQLLNDALDDAGIPAGDIFERVMRLLARTPSGVLSIALEDVLGSLDQVNLPGTDKECPNGRRCVPIDYGELNQKLIALGRHLAADGRGYGIVTSRTNCAITRLPRTN